MTSSSILFITAVIMLAGGLIILFTGKHRTGAEEFHTVCHGLVPLIAAASYFAMAVGQGAVLLPTDTAAAGAGGATRIFYWARYADWSVTTPLLLLTLSMTAMRHETKRWGAVTGLVLSDVLMIVTAFAFGAAETGPVKWTWFIVSCAAFLGVYYVLWKPYAEIAAGERDDIRATYRRNASILSVLWFLYPVVLFFAPDGLNMLSDTASVLCIAVLDVLAKVVYGLMTTAADTKATTRDLGERTTAPRGAVRVTA